MTELIELLVLFLIRVGAMVTLFIATYGSFGFAWAFAAALVFWSVVSSWGQK